VPARIPFAGCRWIVKSSGDVPFGPGPNLWSDAPENVWVDAEGMHLRLVERDGQWTCAEVMSESYIGYGRLRFEVDGAIDFELEGASALDFEDPEDAFYVILREDGSLFASSLSSPPDLFSAAEAGPAYRDFDLAASEYAAAQQLAPEIVEIPFWTAVSLATADRVETALPIFRQVFAREPVWARLVPRLVKSELLPDDDALIRLILDQAPDR